MPSRTYTLFRNAILAEQQVTCLYEGRHRELCPHILGTNKSGEEAVLAWQFGGEGHDLHRPQPRKTRSRTLRRNSSPQKTASELASLDPKSITGTGS